MKTQIALVFVSFMLACGGGKPKAQATDTATTAPAGSASGEARCCCKIGNAERLEPMKKSNCTKSNGTCAPGEDDDVSACAGIEGPIP